jgi:hypothetical protein
MYHALSFQTLKAILNFRFILIIKNEGIESPVGSGIIVHIKRFYLKINKIIINIFRLNSHCTKLHSIHADKFKKYYK